jgi:hypothetical protein
MAMTLKKPSRRAARILLALVFIAGMMASFSAATEQHALAISCTPPPPTTGTVDGETVTTLTYTIGATCDNEVVDHQCVDMGSHGSVSADECADIYLSFSPSNITLWGEGEY